MNSVKVGGLAHDKSRQSFKVTIPEDLQYNDNSQTTALMCMGRNLYSLMDLWVFNLAILALNDAVSRSSVYSADIFNGATRCLLFANSLKKPLISSGEVNSTDTGVCLLDELH